MRTVDVLAARVGRALLARGARLALAESCTGGLVGGRVTSVPGSSRFLIGGVVAYHNSAKAAVLRVPRGMLERWGAVSAPVASAMARGARRVFRADLAVAVTGIAGPGGGSAEKPVGLVYVAVCGFGRTRCRRVLLAGDRGRVRAQAADLALHYASRAPRGGAVNGRPRLCAAPGRFAGRPRGAVSPPGPPRLGTLFPAGSNGGILNATKLPRIPRQDR